MKRTVQEQDLIDLHIHTEKSKSEGTLLEFLELALQKGIKVISFTDHKTLEIYHEVKNLTKEEKEKYQDIQFVIGMEHTCMYTYQTESGEKTGTIDLLGYNFDLEKEEELKQWIQIHNVNTDTREFQERELERLKHEARKLGWIFDDVRIDDENPLAGKLFGQELAKHEENFQGMVNPRIQQFPQMFFSLYCNNENSPFYLDRTKLLPTAQQVAEEFRKCGADVFIPHPFAYQENDILRSLPFIHSIIQDSKVRAKGIEKNYRDYSIQMRQTIEEIAQKQELCISGGSDYHKKQDQGKIPVGQMTDGTSITVESVNLLKWAKTYSLEELIQKVQQIEEKAKEEHDGR